MQILQNFSKLRQLLSKNVVGNKLKLPMVNAVPNKSMWVYVAMAFNRVDGPRLLQVGPDRLCAEWVLKNGGAINTVEAPERIYRDYNSLPPENVRFRVKTVDATGSSIMKIGLDHFRNCNYIDTVILSRCKHLEADGLNGLIFIRCTLKALQISECLNVNAEGLEILEHLTSLERLTIFNMPYIKNWDSIKMNLMKKLPNCEINIS